MRYFLRTLIGFTLIAGSLVTAGYAIYEMLQVGTCASGGPYEIARECPDGATAMGLLIPGAVFALLIGAGIYASRGRAPGSDRDPNHGLVIAFVWTGLFWAIGIACFLGVWGPDANPGPGGKEGGLIVGFLFIPMGALGLLAIPPSAAYKRKLRKAAAKRAKAEEMNDDASRAKRAGFGFPAPVRAATAMATRMPGIDPVERLERLAKLRESGAITESEFQRLKAEVIG